MKVSNAAGRELIFDVYKKYTNTNPLSKKEVAVASPAVDVTISETAKRLNKESQGEG